MSEVRRAAKNFTPKQGQYLAFIHAYTRLHRRPPAEADMQQYFRVSPPSVHQMVLTLERAGFIARQPRVTRNGKGDRPVESLEVKAPGGRPEYRSDPYRGASKLAGRSDCVNQVAPKLTSRVKRIAGSLGMPSRSIRGAGHGDIAVWN